MSKYVDAIIGHAIGKAEITLDNFSKKFPS